MTNSTTKEEKVKKPKGPVRSGALISVSVVLLISFLFARFFLDKTIEKSIEWTASYLHGAQVDVAKVKTKLIQGQAHLYGLAVTDKKKLSHNVIAIGHMRFDLNMDALLRAKIVIEDAAIEGLTLDQERKRPGKIFKLPTAPGKKDSEVKVAGKKVAKVMADELEDNVIGNIAGIAAGDKARDQVGNIRENLEAENKIKELEKTLKQKEEMWDAKIKSFKHNDDLKRLAKDVKAVKVDKKKPWKAIKQYSRLSKEIKAKLKAYKQDAKNLKSDISYFEKSIKDVKKMAKGDLSSLGNRFSVSGLDAKSIASVVFLKLLQEQSGEYYKYILAARDYLPNKKDKKEEEQTFVPRKRGSGQTFQYPITTSYPLFWWKKGDLSIDSPDAKLSGQIRDVSSDPAHLNKPAVLQLSGSLPKHKVKTFNLNGNFDHRQKESVDKIDVEIGGYPVSDKKFIKNKKLTFGLKEAKSSWRVNTEMRGERLSFIIDGLFKDTAYQVASESKTIQEVFSTAVSQIPEVSFRARAQGKWEDLDWKIKSDFADQLSRRLKQALQAKIKAKKEEYLKKIRDKIGPQTAELENKYAKMKSKFDQVLKKQENKAKSLATSALAGTKKGGQSKSKKLEDKAKKLFKKFKF